MNKGLDLIQRQQPEIIDGYPTGNVYIGLTFEELAELEKELKALEIIKEKSINVLILKYSFLSEEGVEYYNKHFENKDLFLTQEQFDLLREVLL